MSRQGAGRGRRKAKVAAGYTLSEVLHKGTVLKDLAKKEWKVGQPIGQGGFGMIYSVDVNKPGDIGTNAPFVLKMEPHDNGPLFCEIHFYQRTCKPELIRKWLSEKKLKSVGVPLFVANGSHDTNGTKNRFMVMQRFGTDLQKKFEENGKKFSRHTVSQLAIKILYSLEYIHSKEYVHADIKAANLLLDNNSNEVFLVDFGLASKFKVESKHRPYQEDPRKAHDGTVEFTSIDAHKGVAPSRRGDLEILGYCLLQWLCGRLPWENKLNNKNYVRDEKIRLMDDIPLLMKTCFPDSASVPDEIVEYLSCVRKLDYLETPNYDSYRKIFKDALSKLGHKTNNTMDFSTNNISPRKRKLSPETHPSPSRLSPSRPSPSRPRGRPRKNSNKQETVVKDDQLSVTGDIENLHIPSWVSHPRKSSQQPDKKKLKSSPQETMATRRTQRVPVETMATVSPARKTKGRRKGKCVATQTSPGLKGLKAMRR